MNAQGQLATLTTEVGEIRRSIQGLTQALRNVNAERTIVFIDNTNLSFSTRKIEGFHLDYNRLVNFLGSGRLLRQVRLYYSDLDPRTILGREEAEKRSDREKFYNYLKQQGFWLKFLPLVSRGGVPKEKGLDAEITKDMQRLAQANVADTFILVAGDLDYKGIVCDSQSTYAVRVEVAFFKDFTATELKYAATRFIDLGEVSEGIRREVSYG